MLHLTPMPKLLTVHLVTLKYLSVAIGTPPPPPRTHIFHVKAPWETNANTEILGSLQPHACLQQLTGWKSPSPHVDLSAVRPL